MSDKIRENKKCLNCGAFVEASFCPKCGQKNTESRKRFTHLFSHFVSDLVHYDGSFWKTLRYLLFFPGKLSTEYMAGKRKSYIDPVKLYIFLSFFAFFLPFMLSPFSFSKSLPDKLDADLRNEMSDNEREEFIREKAVADSLWSSSANVSLDEKIGNAASKIGYGVWEEMIYKGKNRKIIKLFQSFVDYLPKVMLFYMPVFAIFLWLFNIRTERKYFDAGIFTLHFFSFILMVWVIYQIIDAIIGHLRLNDIVIPVFLTYITAYFYVANKKFYNIGHLRNFFTVGALITGNTFFGILTLLLYFIGLAVYIFV